MKTGIHPQYFEEILVTCSCGNTFKTGSTKPELHVEVCYKCHPLYTGEKRFVDTQGQIGKFEAKAKRAQDYQASHKSKKQTNETKKQAEPRSLRELLGEV